MDPEPNPESTMDERALANDLQTADVAETSNTRDDDGEGREEENVPHSDQNFTLVQEGDCRICFDPATPECPIIEVGCQCKNESRYGHESCLTRWYVRQLNRRGTSDCEVCRSSLGPHLETIVRAAFEEASQAPVGEASQARVVPWILIWVELPIEELDRLQVPIDTPTFYQLPRETRRDLIASMNRQEELHLRGGTLEIINHALALFVPDTTGTSGSVHIPSHNAEMPHIARQSQARVREAAELRDRILAGSVVLLAHFPSDESRDTVVDDDTVADINNPAHWDRLVGRRAVDRLMPSGDQPDNRLNEVSEAVDLLAANASVAMSEGMQSESVPHSMTVEPSSDEDIRRDADERRVRGPRQWTYSRFRTYLLRDIP